MRRRFALLALPVAIAAVLAAGCGGDSSSTASPPPPPSPPATTPEPPPPPAKPVKPWRNFTKEELPKIALQPKDAPADLAYLREASGPRRLEDIFVLPEQIQEARSYGFVGQHEAVFASKSAGSDRRVGQSIWLFEDRKGAKGWLAKAREDAAVAQFSPLDAPLLGDESWAARGIFQAAVGQGITHSFRLGNAVFTVLTYGDATPPSEAEALAAAQAALARAKAAG